MKILKLTMKSSDFNKKMTYNAKSNKTDIIY